jgi:hypothetical protein
MVLVVRLAQTTVGNSVTDQIATRAFDRAFQIIGTVHRRH